jgi:hypothetical protein
MLTRSGEFKEDELAEAAKRYLPHYGKKENEVCDIPYREMSTGKVNFVRFTWLNEQWIFTDLVK